MYVSSRCFAHHFSKFGIVSLSNFHSLNAFSCACWPFFCPWVVLGGFIFDIFYWWFSFILLSCMCSLCILYASSLSEIPNKDISDSLWFANYFLYDSFLLSTVFNFDEDQFLTFFLG